MLTSSFSHNDFDFFLAFLAPAIIDPLGAIIIVANPIMMDRTVNVHLLPLR
nr:MAG: hypothetical protein [Bacteriophage sp.]